MSKLTKISPDPPKYSKSIKMNKNLIITSALAVCLFTICYEFPSHSNNPTLASVLLSIYNSTSILTLTLATCIFLIFLDLTKEYLQNFFSSQKQFAQKISVQEYNSQKSTYTQLKLNELFTSQAYKEYQSKQGLNNK